MNPAIGNPVHHDSGRLLLAGKIDFFAERNFKHIAKVAIGAMVHTDPLHAADVLRFTADKLGGRIAQIGYLWLSPIGEHEDLRARFEVYVTALLDEMMEAGIRDEVWLSIVCDAFLIGGLAAFDRLVACPAPGQA